MQKNAFLIIISMTLFMPVIFFQNCSSGLHSLSSSEELSSSSYTDRSNYKVDPEDLHTGSWPRGEFINSDCLNLTERDTCIIYKNPVFMQSSAFDGGLKNNTPLYDLNLQNFSVNLSAMDDSGFLQNKYFEVNPNSVDDNSIPRVTRSQLKFVYEENYSLFNQIMTYYWVNEIRAYLSNRAKVSLTQGHKIYIDSYVNINNNAYFVPDSEGQGASVLLGYSSLNENLHQNAVSGEIAVHEVCHGLYHFASNGNDYSIDTTTTVNDNGEYKCNSSEGCNLAIHEGQADFCAFMMFPDSTTIGDSFINDTDGFDLRNQSKNKDFDKNDFFSLSEGRIHDFGGLYASMWREVWLMVKNENSGREVDIESLFVLHLSLLDYRDTYRTALDSIRFIISLEYPNQGYIELFENEWARRRF